MKVHLLDGQSGRLWCGTRKLRKDDLIATTARFEHIEEQMLDDKLVVDDPDKGTFLRDPEFLGPGSIDYYIAGGDAGSVCADCLSALERERSVTWQPMTPEEAREVLSSEPPGSPAELRRWSDRYTEAWMVSEGAPPERIKAAMEQLRGHQLET